MKRRDSLFQTFNKLNHLLMGDQKVHVYTEHRNMLYGFATKVFQPNTGRHVISKVQRWAIFLSQFEFNIEHVDSKETVFADMLEICERGYRVAKMETGKVIEQTYGIAAANEIIWPDYES